MKNLLHFVEGQRWFPFRIGRKKDQCAILVQAFYRSAFGRSADPVGIAHYLPRLQAGLSLEAFAEELAESEEFQARFGSSATVDTKFLHNLYRNALGRPPDSAGLAWWLAEGEKGTPPFKVLAALASSDQVLERFRAPQFYFSREPEILITALFRAAFGRIPEKNDLENGASEVRSKTSLEFLADDLVRSVEFRERHGPDESLGLAFITDVYLDGLGRRPDLASLGHWLSEGQKGASRADLLIAIARSDEASERLSADPLNSRAYYRRWIAGNDAITPLDRAAILKHIGELPIRPFISVILPAVGTSEALLRESLGSLQAQLYPGWELCIGLDEASKPKLGRIAEDFTQSGSRVLLALSGPGEDTIVAARSALTIATGEFVSFLLPGDRLPEHALYEVAVALNGKSPKDVVYTDSDQIDSHGERFNPCFKPGFDPDLLLSYNYIGNLVVYRRTLLQTVGRLRSECKEAAYHDLILRATARTTPERVVHIPTILYHEREKTDKLDKQLPPLPSREVSERAAVRDFLDRQGHIAASLIPISSTTAAFRIAWPLPAREPLVSIIVPTRNRADLLSRCVAGILHRTDYSNWELLIVDNESCEQPTLDLFNLLSKRDSRVQVLQQPGQFNYSALNNAAAKKARGEILVLLNNDTDVINADWLRELVSQAIRPDVGAVGGKLLYENETIQHAGIVLGPRGAAMHIHRFAHRNDPGYFGQLAVARTLSAVTGACLAIRRTVYFEVGGMDEVNLPVSYNDVDLCLRVQAHAYRVVWTPFAELFHLESVSRGVAENDQEKYQRARSELRHLRRTWEIKTESGDRFYNPNLRFGWGTFEMPSASRRERPWVFVYLRSLNER